MVSAWAPAARRGFLPAPSRQKRPLPPGVPHPKGPHARPRLVCHHPAGPAVGGGRTSPPHPLPGCPAPGRSPGLEDFVSRHGATVVNLAFARALRRLEDWRTPKTQGFRVALVGLGDVGRTVLAGLVLLGAACSGRSPSTTPTRPSAPGATWSLTRSSPRRHPAAPGGAGVHGGPLPL